MILQINNNKILNTNFDLVDIIDPSNGDAYFIDDIKKMYSYHKTPKGVAGHWSLDDEAVIYEKVTVLSVGFTDVTAFFTNVSSFIDDEVRLINIRSYDGQEAYKLTLAELRLARVANNIPHELFNENVYVPLDSMINHINIGGWISAYEELNKTAINAIFTESMKKDFRLKLSNYIVHSGNYQEYTNNTIDADGFIV